MLDFTTVGTLVDHHRIALVSSLMCVALLQLIKDGGLFICSP